MKVKNNIQMVGAMHEWAAFASELNDQDFKFAIFDMLLTVRSLSDTSDTLVMTDKLIKTFMEGKYVKVSEHECDFGGDGKCKVCGHHRPPR